MKCPDKQECVKWCGPACVRYGGEVEPRIQLKLIVQQEEQGAI